MSTRWKCEAASALAIWASLRSSVCTMLTAGAIIVSFVCPCLPLDNCSFDQFDEAGYVVPMGFEHGGFDEPPSEADILQSAASTITTMPPTIPCNQVAEPPPPPKRRRVGRNISESRLPESTLGDDDIKAAFSTFIKKRYCSN